MKFNLVFFLGLFFILSCSNNEIPKPITRNLIILLDLSDRLIANSTQFQTDLQNINDIISIYLSSIKDTIIHYDKDFNLISDKFSIRIAHQKNIQYDPHYFENSLRFDLSNKKEIPNILQNFQTQAKSLLDSLYKIASRSKNKSDYHGADIWKFFNEDIQNLLDTSSKSKNYLIILTDGYMYFENYQNQLKNSNRFTDMSFFANLRNKEWEKEFDKLDLGLISPKIQLPNNLKVAVIGVDPKDFWNEFSLLKKVWFKWFNEMNIPDENLLFLKNDNTNLIKEKLKNFIN